MNPNNDINDLRDVANSALNNKNKTISKDIDSIASDLIDNVTKAKLPEPIFVEYFLDFFKTGANESDKSLALKWVMLSGSPMHEVDIVDNSGKVLFTTPPILARPDDVEQDIAKTSFSNIVTEFHDRTNRLAVDGDNFAKQALSGLEDKVTVSVDESKSRWNGIFKRYEKEDGTKVKVTTIDSSKDNLDEVIDYD